MTTYTIRQMADEFGLTLRAIRFYEQRGLLSSGRTANFATSPRVSGEDDRARLAEIVNLTRMGFTLAEIAKGETSADQYKQQLAFCYDKIDELETAALLIKKRLSQHSSKT